MATGQPTATPGIFHLPLTGHRNGKYGIVIGYTLVLDDEFTRNVLPLHSWRLNLGYAMTTSREDGRTILLHRSIFEHYHGSIPDGLEVDHIDRNKLNNLPTNLRAVTQSQNSVNVGMRRRNRSGFVGVNKCERVREWRAGVRVLGKYIHLGRFLTREEAAAAVNRAYAQHFPHVPPPNPTVAF
jgi:hypothetical protein